MPTSAAVKEALHDAKLSELEKNALGLSIRFDRHLEIYAQNGKELAALKVAVSQVQETMQEVSTALQSLGAHYVTNDRFLPVKSIAYGIIGTCGIATLGALLTLVIK
ncbi:hypothetical protein [Parerythrobacter lacustris]|uniref:TMhelix containing protein n=1 Tax=Parerythrobacter lacustris TaxID=2969984 RepID=A0ABT1XP80_9SPHN|nr:hypothetical protein [Parerythrobacter lacustris]MCR2833469.1 hypothetical protein [Parerythrobacter lacustris]